MVLASHSFGIRCNFSSFSIVNLPFFSSHKSASIRNNGTQSPVSKKAAATPNPASIPNDLNAAISDVKFARNATMVVDDVSKIALPTREIDSSAEFVIDFPFFLSSLYRCSA